MALSQNLRVNVRRRRKELGLTQQQLADLMGKPREYVAQVETEDRSRTLDVVEDFARALKCPALSLLMANEEEHAAA